MSAGISYATSWNQEALANVSLKKADLKVPVSKKSAQSSEKTMEELQSIAKAFGLQDAQPLVDVAEALDTMVRTSITERGAKDSTSKKPAGKKGKDSSTSSSSSSPSPAPPTDFPPLPSNSWVMTTSTQLLSHCADWVLRVRPSESNTLLYAVVLEIFSILAHRRPLLTSTRGGNGLRVTLHALFDEYYSPKIPFNFADGLGKIEEMSDEALSAADRQVVDATWAQRLSAFSSRISKVPIDFSADDDAGDESIKEFAKEQIQTMLTVSANHHHPYHHDDD